MARPRRGGQHFEKMLATSLDFFVVSNSRSAQVSFISMETAISFWLLPRVPRIERDKRFVATCGCFRSRKKKKEGILEKRCVVYLPFQEMVSQWTTRRTFWPFFWGKLIGICIPLAAVVAKKLITFSLGP